MNTLNNFALSQSKIYKYLRSTKNTNFFVFKEKEGTIYSNIEESYMLKFKALVIEGLDASDFTEDTSTKAALKVLCEEFQRVALYRNNVLRIGRNNCFIDYLRGVPGILNYPIYYHEQYDILEKFLSIEDLRSKFDTDQIDGLFYWSLERAVNELLKEHGLKKLNQLDIIN